MAPAGVSQRDVQRGDVGALAEGLIAGVFAGSPDSLTARRPCQQLLRDAWQFERTAWSGASGSRLVASSTAHAADDAIDELEVVLIEIRRVMDCSEPVNVQAAKRWLRDQGDRGTAVASMLSKLSKLRNAQAHPLARRVLGELECLARHPPAAAEPAELALATALEAPLVHKVHEEHTEGVTLPAAEVLKHAKNENARPRPGPRQAWSHFGCEDGLCETCAASTRDLGKASDTASRGLSPVAVDAEQSSSSSGSTCCASGGLPSPSGSSSGGVTLDSRQRAELFDIYADDSDADERTAGHPSCALPAAASGSAQPPDAVAAVGSPGSAQTGRVRRRGSGFKRWEEKRRCQHFSTSFIAGFHREVQEGLLSFNFAREYAIQNGDRDKLASLRAMRGELAAIAKPIRGTQFKASGVVDARLGSLAEARLRGPALP